MVSELKKHTMWNVFGNVGGKLLMPLFQVLIARQLHPKYYGTFGVAMALVYLFDIVKDLGFTEAIIVDRHHNDISSQYTLQLLMAFIMYILLVLSSSFFSIFFKNHEYMTVLPIIGLVFFAKAIIDPLTTLYLKRQMFKMLALRQIMFPVIFGVSGYVFAKMGWGIYALVVSTLLSYIFVAITFYADRKEPLHLVWDIKAKRKLFELGKHILIQRMAGYGVHQGDTFVIGKFLGMCDLGLYKASSYIVNSVPNCVINQTQQVLFTELALHKSNHTYMRHRYEHFVKYSGLFLLLYMFILCSLVPYLVMYLLGWQWRMTIPVVQIFSCSVVVSYITGVNSDLSRILNFTNVYTKYFALRSIVTIVIIIILSFISLKAAVCGWVFAVFLSFIFNEMIFLKNQKIMKNDIFKNSIFVISFIWFVLVAALIYFKSDIYINYLGGKYWIFN